MQVSVITEAKSLSWEKGPIFSVLGIFYRLIPTSFCWDPHSVTIILNRNQSENMTHPLAK